MEEHAINMPHNGGRQENERIARSDTFRRHDPQRTSSGQAIQQERSSSTTVDSPGTSSSLRSTASYSYDNGTHQGEDPISPSATNGRELTLDEYRTLLQAAIKGDWPAAMTCHKNYPGCVRAPITKEEARALHIAVIAQRTTFIKEWLTLMDPKDLELKNIYGFTALHCAAESGIVGIAKQLVKKNEESLFIPDNVGDVPLNVAAYTGHANMVSYLLRLTSLERLNEAKRIEFFRYTIFNELYDIALKILKTDSSIVTADTECGWKALRELAKKPFAIGSESQLSFWKSRLNSWLKGTCNEAVMKTSLQYQLVVGLLKLVGSPDKEFSSNSVHPLITLLFEAAKVGNVEFLIILIRFYPDLIWQQDENNMSIFHFAILNRHESVFKLIYEIGATKDSLAAFVTLDTKDNMLHLAGKLPPFHRLNIVSGAALQMQRELLWFEEIKKIVRPSYVNMKNEDGKTPKEMFINAHEDLQKDGEKWMKNTANSCMLVATLITTMIFASAFTVPGGNNQETGKPILLRRNWFMVFFISNAIALCFSSTSMAIFLSILTSRYTEEDFLKLLPTKLMVGLSTLFISMASMMVAFCATCFLMYTSTRAWTRAVVFISAGIPITSFILLHCKIWFDAFLSTYKSRFPCRPYKHRLF